MRIDIWKRRITRGIPAALALAVCVSGVARCQEAGDVTLRIQFAGSQSQFHVGETIPLKLAFSSSAEKTYEFNDRKYDRSGRLGLDEFHVSPSGRDPLYDYYGGGLFGFFGGGISSGPSFLGNNPKIVREDLNEWVALDRPGQYALYVTSSRVSRRVGSKSQVVGLRSNTLYFEIVAADAAWQAQTLGPAISILDDPGSSPDERRSAFRTLRFLDSPGSVRELVKLLGTPGNQDSWDCLAGLLGSAHRRLVLSELEAQFAASDTAITSRYLTALVTTRFMIGRKPLPPYPARGPRQSQVQAEYQERLRQFKEALRAAYARTAEIVATKQGRAKAETVRTLVSIPESGPSAPKPWELLSGDTLASAFLLWKPGEQSQMLQTEWERLKVPAMAEALESVLGQPQIDDQYLRDFAVQRLYALDPEAGAARILEEIRQPHADLTASAGAIHILGSLPNKTLPQFDDLLATRLEKGDGVAMAFTARLIGRYSTKAILPRVKAVYLREPGKWDCGSEDGLMMYFLRVDPDFAVRQMRDAPNLCMPDAFLAAVKMGRWPAIEPTIIGKLNDPNLETARQAAEVLRMYGGEKAEKALWTRLRQFHEQWATRAGELRYRPDSPAAARVAMGLQGGLVEALGRAQEWLLDDSQIAKLERLTLGTERDNVAQWRWKAPLELSVNFTFDGRMQAYIGGVYSTTDVSSLCAKLAEFPAGTQLHVNASGPRENVEPVMRAIEDAAQEDGLDVKVVN